jgi:hypothetical protein
VRWVDAENMSYEEAVHELEQADGVLVPGGFGSRGWEGKILACQVAREQEIPYLGICLGMHVAVSEFARHVCGLEGANSTEMDPETPFPVIDLLPEQKEIEDLGGTMRLGAQAVELGTAPAREAHGESACTSATGTATRSTTLPVDGRGGLPFRDVPGGRSNERRPSLVRGQPVPPEFKSRRRGRRRLPRLRRRARLRASVSASPFHRLVWACPATASSSSSSSSRRSRARRFRERPVAERARYLRDLVEADEDAAGLRSADAGKHLRRSHDGEGAPILFCAHLDTVELTG